MASRHAGILAAVLVGFALAGCGGGGGSDSGDDGGSSTPPPAPGPSGTVTITPRGPVTATATVGETATAILEGTWKASDGAAGAPVHLKVVDLGDAFNAPGVKPAPTNGTFRYELAIRNDLIAGMHADRLEITACADTACSQTYGTPVQVDYRIEITSLGEWETLMRDASHTSYVPTRIDPARLKLAWEWTAPMAPSAVESYIARPTTTSGSLLVISGNTMSDGSQRGSTVVQFDEADGTSRWNRPISDELHGVAPGSNGKLVYLAKVGGNELITALDGKTGAVAFTYAETTQPLATTLAPSRRDGTMYFFAGYNGDELHAANAETGVRDWAMPRVGLLSATPTIDDTYVYYPAGQTIEMLDRRTGAHVASIFDPSADGTPLPGSGAVVLGGRGNLIARSYRDGYGARLSSFSIADRSWEWTTTSNYNQFFAVADGVIYALRGGYSLTLDAIDERNGQVLWSWSPPAEYATQKNTLGNVVATQGMVFFGTQDNTGGTSWVWAVDTAQRKDVWRTPGAGYIVISGSRTVYLCSGPPGGLMNRVRALRMR